MRITFDKNTKNDIQKYKDSLRRTKKVDGHKYQNYEIDNLVKNLKKSITQGLTDLEDHTNSIFPKECEYKAVIGYGLMFALWWPFIELLGMF